MLEDNDIELDKFMEELDKYDDEIEALNSQMDNYFDWFDILSELEEILRIFVSNMNSLSSIYKSIPDSLDNNFLIGTLWSGIISAYEGFVHELFDLLLSKNIHAQEAVKKFTNLKEPIKYKRLKGENQLPTIDELRFLFRRATLNNPNKGVALANHLFGIDIPEIDANEMASALAIRHAYTHNNGGKSVSISSLDQFHSKIDSLVSCYVNGILDQANRHLITE